MTASRPPVDRAAARRAALELARVTEELRTKPPGVTRIKLPLALEVLDHCGGDPVLAICLIAGLVDPAAAADRGAPVCPSAPLLRLVPTPPTPINRRNAL